MAAKSKTKRFRFLIGLLVTLAVAAAILAIAPRAAERATAIDPARLAKWDAEMAADRAILNARASTEMRVADAAAGPSGEPEWPKDPTRREIWAWIERIGPESLKDPQMASARKLAGISGGPSDVMKLTDLSRLLKFCAADKAPSSSLTPEEAARLRLEMRGFTGTNHFEYELLDGMLAAERLPWPLQAAASELPDFPRSNLFRTDSLMLLALAGALGSETGREEAKNVERLLRLDRLANVELPYPIVLTENFGELGFLDELTGNGGSQGVFPLDRIGPADARALLANFPAPSCENAAFEREKLRLLFEADREAAADAQLSMGDYIDDLDYAVPNDAGGLQLAGFAAHPSLSNFPGIGLIRGCLEQVEISAGYYRVRDARMKAIVQAQERVEQAAIGDPSEIKGLSLDAAGWNRRIGIYKRTAADIAGIEQRNDRRVLIHAVLTAREYEGDPAARAAKLQALSDKFAEGRLAAEETSGGLKLSLGGRTALAPKFGD